MAHGRIKIDEELCKGCELCIHVCPYDLIRQGEAYNVKGYRPVVVVDAHHRCSGCTLCAMICPDAVITVFREVKAKPAYSLSGL